MQYHSFKFTSLIFSSLDAGDTNNMGVFIRWTGMDYWTTGMDYWNTGMDYWNTGMDYWNMPITSLKYHTHSYTAKG